MAAVLPAVTSHRSPPTKDNFCAEERVEWQHTTHQLELRVAELTKRLEQFEDLLHLSEFAKSPVLDAPLAAPPVQAPSAASTPKLEHQVHARELTVTSPKPKLEHRVHARELTVTSFEVTGACSNVASVNDVYSPAGSTADGRLYYEGQTNGRFLYFDAECDGETINDDDADRWIIDLSEPSTTASIDLDGDNACSYYGRISDSGSEPPFGTNAWNLYCDSGWTATDLTLTVLSSTSVPTPLTSQPTSSPTACYESMACCDTEDGATDRFGGEVCADYVGNTNWCGNYDDSDFTAEEMCCACGGGTGAAPSPRSTPQPSPQPMTPAPTIACYDTNDGALDLWGDGCNTYSANPSWCDSDAYDDNDFTVHDMCCACGGGTPCADTDDGSADPYGNGCEEYSETPDWCGEYESPHFSSEILCCACGGGSTRVTPSPTVSNDPTISPAPTTFGNFEVATFGELSDAIESAPNSGRQWVITLIGRISIRSMLDLAPGTSIKLAGPLTQPQVRVFPTLANNADGFLFMVRWVYSLW